MPYVSNLQKLGQELHDLARDQAEWSRKTFGEDHQRGPAGPLKHLAKEATEASGAWMALRNFVESDVPGDATFVGPARKNFESEMADCLLLVLDASRRGGMSPKELIAAADRKLQVVKTRHYPKTADPDAAVEHDRTRD